MIAYKTGLADIYTLDNGIQKEVWRTGELTDVAIVQQHMERIHEELKEETDILMLIDSSRTTKMSKEVRDYLGDYTIEPLPDAVALLVSSGISKVIGTLFLKFKKIPYPMRLFTNENKAIKWLLEYKR